MKSISLTFVVLLAGCGPSSDDVRKMIRDEFARHTERSYVTSAQVIGPYSPSVVVGSMVFVSGQIGLDPATSALAGPDIELQTRQALKNLEGILHEAGCDSSNVVQCTVYLRHMQDFQKMNLIYGGYFREGSYPARTTVEVANLPKEAVVEIAAVAVRRK